MDILIKLYRKVFGETELGKAVRFIIIAIAFMVGLAYQTFSKKIDTTAEQIAEKVLQSNGVNVDFSKEKKKN